MRERLSDRSSVKYENGVVTIRTPEGQQINLTLERAAEWASFGFRKRLSAVLDAAIVPYGIPQPVDQSGE